LGFRERNHICYHDGQQVRIDNVVDVGGGNGPLCHVVVIIPSGEAAPGFEAQDWAYLERGVMLQEEKVFGVLHLETLSCEHTLVRRAQPGFRQ
jgi:hypothetical protein